MSEPKAPAPGMIPIKASGKEFLVMLIEPDYRKELMDATWVPNFADADEEKKDEQR